MTSRAGTGGRVVVVGSVNVDLVASVDRLPAVGETVTEATFARHDGGKGGNQAVAAARLGAPVAFVGAVGDDPFGPDARTALATEGVDATGLINVPGPTGVAVILVDRRGENVIAVASGANAAVTADLVAAALDRLAVGSGDVVLVSHEIPTDAAVAALRIGQEAGATTILNPAPAPGLERAHLRWANLVIPNRGELAELARAELRRTGHASRPDAAADPAGQARALLDAGSAGPGVRDAVVVTLGAGGALIVARDGPTVAVAAPSVIAIDGVGAGDTFAGALAASLVGGWDLEGSVRRAVAAASLSTTRPGARGGMPTHDELTAFLGRN